MVLECGCFERIHLYNCRFHLLPQGTLFHGLNFTVHCLKITWAREARDLIFKIRSCTVRSDLKIKTKTAENASFLRSDLTVQDRILKIRSLASSGSSEWNFGVSTNRPLENEFANPDSNLWPFCLPGVINDHERLSQSKFECCEFITHSKKSWTSSWIDVWCSEMAFSSCWSACRTNRKNIPGLRSGTKKRGVLEGVFRREFCKNVRLSWLWRSECQMYCWPLDPAPFARTPFSWFLRRVLQWRGGGDPPKGQLAPDPHLGGLDHGALYQGFSPRFS